MRQMKSQLEQQQLVIDRQNAEIERQRRVMMPSSFPKLDKS